ncbi:YiiX/YebB-like N1pC/P60 family cysteine hydrolase [Pantoea sp. At-9b]|uniref:YiiX/YebB-like N1pC/P60 family cysteine hydrolase n=1 Tax=Pantoea sp. (strain At-9b) TaxID=592316 RepID=UPI0001B3E838|nr:YiiX/YebB-like N1pC/P60 family cysteine hydrolase [Pantoea sp. At-9b]ADU69582.1 hypothetical protein Pat9b_2277 [Pantoea sp. At-9b]
MDAVTDIRKKYILNLGALMPGDIILEHGYKIHSQAIIKVTKSYYSHAMLYEGSTIIEATSNGGVFSKVPNRFAVVGENDIKVLRLKSEVNADVMKLITTTSRTLVGSSYSTSEAIKAGKDKKPKTANVKGQFCSRLVAQCYKAGGVKIVENVNYCSPGDLERSPFLIPVENALKEATEDELAHALAPTIHRKHQESTVQWVKAAKKILKKSGVEVETINDIHHATMTLKDPKVDKLILKEIIKSGHYEFYLADKEVNPFRYDIDLFSDAIKGDLSAINSEIHKEVSIVEVQSLNLQNTIKNFEIYPSKLMAAEVSLCKDILTVVAERLKIIVDYCEDKKLSPEYLPIAMDMIKYIRDI